MGTTRRVGVPALVPALVSSGFAIGHVVASRATPQFIAEIGINHGGSLEVAKEIARLHVEAGAAIVKGQTHESDEYAPRARKVVPANASEPVDALVARCSLDEADERELQRYVGDLGAVYISTPFSRRALDRLDRMGVPAIKIGSGEVSNHGLLELVAQLGRPVIMSTGMHSLASVAEALGILRAVPVALMHTTSLYPTTPEAVRLDRMAQLEVMFARPVGFSDHSIGIIAALAAVARGAVLVERHVTDTLDRVGPDIVCSSPPGETRELVESMRTIALACGGVADADIDGRTRDFAASAVTALCDLAPGDKLMRENCFPMRPGPSGADIPGDHYRHAIGRAVVRHVEAGTPLTYQDIEGA